jgi:hypothetical protein
LRACDSGEKDRYQAGHGETMHADSLFRFEDFGPVSSPAAKPVSEQQRTVSSE